MATHPSILAWRILGTEEPGREQSTGLQRVRHDWISNTCIFKMSSLSLPVSVWISTSSSSQGKIIAKVGDTVLEFLCTSQVLLFSHSVMTPRTRQHTRLPCPSLSPRICLNSCPLSRWCYPTISSSVIPFSSWLQSCPASGSFLKSWLFLPQVAKVLEFQTFQWIFRVDFLEDWPVWSPCCPRDSPESSPAPQFKNINSSTYLHITGRLSKRPESFFWGILYFKKITLDHPEGILLQLVHKLMMFHSVERKWSCSVMSNSLQPHGL